MAWRGVGFTSLCLHLLPLEQVVDEIYDPEAAATMGITERGQVGSWAGSVARADTVVPCMTASCPSSGVPNAADRVHARGSRCA